MADSKNDRQSTDTPATPGSRPKETLEDIIEEKNLDEGDDADLVPDLTDVGSRNATDSDDQSLDIERGLQEEEQLLPDDARRPAV